MDAERLLQDIRHEPPGDTPSTVVHVEYERKVKRLLLQVFGYLVIGLLIMYFGATVLMNAQETRNMIWGAVFILIGFEITILIKLAYGNLFTALRTEKVVKELHLDLIERLGQAPDTERNRS